MEFVEKIHGLNCLMCRCEMSNFMCFAFSFMFIGIGLFGISGAYAVYAYAKSIFHETHIDEINFALWLKENHNE